MENSQQKKRPYIVHKGHEQELENKFITAFINETQEVAHSISEQIKSITFTSNPAIVKTIDILKELKDTGFIDASSDIAQWLRDNVTESEPEDSLSILICTFDRAKADKKDIIETLQTIKAKAATMGVNFYDLLRSYSSGIDIDKPVSVTAIKTDKLQYPLDVINSKVWQALATSTEHMIKVEKDGSKRQLSISYSINFDALDSDITISRELTPFDKRVYIAISSLYDAGNEYISLSQVHKEMGNSGLPSQNQLDKINDSITKLRNATISVNNKEESEFYSYPHFKYDGSLLPFERVSATVNGKTTNAAIHLFRQPPLFTFAQQRKQLTTIDSKLLKSPVSKTELNLAIDDYLITRIARTKGGHTLTILCTTLYEKTGITTAKQKHDARKKTETYLEHYKKCGTITGYEFSQDKIIIKLSQNDA